MKILLENYNRKTIKKLLLRNSIAQKLFGARINSVIERALNAYEQKHRYYHNISHLENLFCLIDSFKHTPKERKILQLVALFHDVVYDPRPNPYNTNEELSVNRFVSVANPILNRQNKAYIKTITKMIEETQYGKKEGTTGLSKWFNEADLWTLIYGNFNDLLKNEKLIFKEYQFNSYPTYKEGRIKFLNFISKHEMVRGNAPNIRLLIQYVNEYIPTIGIYAGSFNPFHVGHKNILDKASKLFDKVIVAVGYNPEKEGSSDLTQITSSVPFYEVNRFNGALSEYIKSVETYAKVTLVRGLRNGLDCSYEINQLRFIEDMYGGYISFVLIPCDREYDYISSSSIRAIRTVDNEFSKKYLI